MASEKRSLSELLSVAIESKDATCASLTELRIHGHETVALALLDEIIQRVRPVNEQEVNNDSTPSAKFEAPLSTENPNHSRLVANSGDARREINSIPISSRDISLRTTKNRHLNAMLKGDLIVIFLAINPNGVSSRDIAEEFSRLNVEEPPGTIGSRISRLRESGVIHDMNRKNTGIYGLTESGYQMAKKAVAERGINVEIRAPSEATKSS